MEIMPETNSIAVVCVCVAGEEGLGEVLSSLSDLLCNMNFLDCFHRYHFRCKSWLRCEFSLSCATFHNQERRCCDGQLLLYLVYSCKDKIVSCLN